MMKTEDEVRDYACAVLGFDDGEKEVKQGTGQITTFKQLGFTSGTSYKPDGWYLPKNTATPAIILETKAQSINIFKDEYVEELMKNVAVAKTKYSEVTGILYNYDDIRVFKNSEEIPADTLSSVLENKIYYLRLWQINRIDKQLIYRLTKSINENLNANFGVKNLYHRMIFTACSLVAERYGAMLETLVGRDYSTLKAAIFSSLSKAIEDDKKQNDKIEILLETYSAVQTNYIVSVESVARFILDVCKISKCVNSDYWHGEDVMGIFFNEFNRYKSKSEHGQVFTPDHITSLMYRILDVHMNDNVLDAACGSGAFLVKAMANMIDEAGGVNTGKAARIKKEQLFGIEFDKEIYSLACANMMIHKDGKTNLAFLDSRYEEAGDWISKKPITKVLMNPPFETKYGCMLIVKNVLDHVSPGTKCAFILPDKKLEKAGGRKLLKSHCLEKIIKLPENVFSEGVTTSVFVFTAKKRQNNNRIFGCYISDDGLVTVKNQGRQDLKSLWPMIEDRWVEIIREQRGDDSIQWIDPNFSLSYRMPEKPFKLFEEDFNKTVFDYLMFKHGADSVQLKTKVMNSVMYGSDISSDENGTTLISISGNGKRD